MDDMMVQMKKEMKKAMQMPMKYYKIFILTLLSSVSGNGSGHFVK
jgi:hypothetical protein